MIEFVEVDAARAASGVRIVAPGQVASPWSEAAKGLLRVAGVPALAVRMGRTARDAVVAWTGADNVPIVIHDGEPPRTNWAAIVGLVARLAPATILPTDLEARADVMGVLEMIAGEDGLGWNSRRAMISASLASDGARGFSLRVAGYLAQRYASAPAAPSEVRERVAGQLAILDARLAAAQGRGHPYFGGERPNALDVYSATFLTPLSPLAEADCPRMAEGLRIAFSAAAAEFGALVSAELGAHRRRMLEQHLGWPIEI